ncbi:MAG: hypothetical protein ACYDGM_05105 [Vulcanimicrobiaceae bacterium]
MQKPPPERSDATRVGGDGYTLGTFFGIWGERLSRQRVGPCTGRVTAFVNGKQYAGNLNKIDD